ncbi:unnamed protein product [Cochlearia groenlandica]
MEKQVINKRKRVCSLQQNKKSHKAMFIRRYTHHLIPSLNKININKPSPQINQKSLRKTVKHEVDMALALSSQEFAWSRFLQQKLLSSPHQEDSSYSSKIQERSKYEHDDDDDDEEEEEIKKRFKELQNLLPGGEEMKIDEMLNEIGSYIVCLELQMIVLKSLVQDNTL